MVLRIQRIGDGFGVMLPPEAMTAMRLGEGAAVEIVAPEDQTLAKMGPEYASDEEVMEAFLATEPDHRNSYRELAK